MQCGPEIASYRQETFKYATSVRPRTAARAAAIHNGSSLRVEFTQQANLLPSEGSRADERRRWNIFFVDPRIRSRGPPSLRGNSCKVVSFRQEVNGARSRRHPSPSPSPRWYRSPLLEKQTEILWPGRIGGETRAIRFT